MRDNVLALNVYFNRLEFTAIDELEKIPFIDLVSGTGGLIGLFLGMSFLTIFEYIELLYSVLVVYFLKNKTRKSKQTGEAPLVALEEL